MDRASGVALVDAVAASCAVPGIWPPVTIAERRYMDGGVRSTTNADLARGSDRILILNPIGEAANTFSSCILFIHFLMAQSASDQKLPDSGSETSQAIPRLSCSSCWIASAHHPGQITVRRRK
jgi:predicted acylesterase/phospholipase RssA